MKQRDEQFTILSALAMLLVILGHINWDILGKSPLLPYYSYHVMIFVFISGYFFKPEATDKMLEYIWRKFKKLMVPYFIWNAVYGLLAWGLRFLEFEIGGDFNLYNLFLAPFMGGHQFMFNAAAWFVPALFLFEVVNIIIVKVLKILHFDNEYILAAVYIFAGVLVVALAMRGSVYDYYKIPGRMMMMAPAFALGRLYKIKIKQYDTMPSVIYIPVVVLLSFVMVRTHPGLNYSAVWVTGFTSTVFTPIVTMILGIAFWLRISKLLYMLLSKIGGEVRRFVLRMGSNTYAIMMHQLLGFFFVNTIYAIMRYLNVGFVRLFDMSAYHSDIYYTFEPGGEIWKLVYVLAGIAIPLMIQRACDKE